MKKIYKYELMLSSEKQFIVMPEEARVLTVQEQNGKIVMWAIIDTGLELEDRQFIVFGTGHKMQELDKELFYDYIGTVQMFHGKFIWHVFEIR